MIGERPSHVYGKGARMLLANLAACRDVVIWAIDLKRGVELRPWAPCPDRLATTPAEGLPVGDLITVTGMSRRWVFCRLRQLAAVGYAVQTVRGYGHTAR